MVQETLRVAAEVLQGEAGSIQLHDTAQDIAAQKCWFWPATALLLQLVLERVAVTTSIHVNNSATSPPAG